MLENQDRRKVTRSKVGLAIAFYEKWMLPTKVSLILSVFIMCAFVLLRLLVERGEGGLFVGEVFLGEAKKIRPTDIISSSCDHTSNSTLQTSHPSPKQLALDTPAMPADCLYG